MWDKSLQGVMVVVNTILGDVPTYYFFGKLVYLDEIQIIISHRVCVIDT